MLSIKSFYFPLSAINLSYQKRLLIKTLQLIILKKLSHANLVFANTEALCVFFCLAFSSLALVRFRKTYSTLPLFHFYTSLLDAHNLLSMIQNPRLKGNYLFNSLHFIAVMNMLLLRKTLCWQRVESWKRNWKRNLKSLLSKFFNVQIIFVAIVKRLHCYDICSTSGY